MKYMTAELLARFRAPDDKIADQAAEEWERQCQAYARHLQEIDKSLTVGARRLLRRHDLHDAKILTMARDEVPHFSFYLELEDSSQLDGKRRLEIRYRLVGGGKGLTSSSMRTWPTMVRLTVGGFTMRSTLRNLYRQ
jgi:hypothetical protein